MERWLTEHWVPAALITAIALTLVVPLLPQHGNLSQILIFSLLPIYMFHQVEEHIGDRFRTFVNQKVFRGVEGLSPLAVLWINLPGVWGVGLLSIYAATFVGVGWGLSMVYLTLVNWVAHVVAAALWRQYNPGLWTALTLFVPVGAWALWRVSGEPDVCWVHHVVGLAVGWNPYRDRAVHAAPRNEGRGAC
jgi:hypothetical protein